MKLPKSPLPFILKHNIHIFVGLLCMTFLLMAAIVAIRTKSTPKASAESIIIAKRADDFLATIGVNIHSQFYGTTYDNYAAWKARLIEGGFRHVRTNLDVNDPTNDNKIKDLNASGIKVMVLARPVVPFQSYYNYLKANPGLAQAISQFEGPNETTDMTATRNYMISMHNLIHSDPSMANIKIVAPSLAWNGTQTTLAGQLGDLSAYVDYANLHAATPGNCVNDEFINSAINVARTVAPGKPLIASEEDWSTQQPRQADSTWAPTAEPQAANIIARNYFENFRFNVLATDPYEFLDEKCDNSFEGTFGFLHCDYSPKPTFTLIKAITTLLKDTGTAKSTFTPGQLAYSLTGTTANTRSVLLQKSDNSFWLVVWEQAEVWDSVNQTPVTPASIPMTLQLAQAANGSVYVPEKNDINASASFSNSVTVPFTSSPSLTLIKIEGNISSATSTPPPAISPSPTASATPAITSFPSPTSTPAPSPTSTPIPTPTLTPTPTPTPTRVPTPTPTISLSGNGLKAVYYNNKDFTGTMLSRTDGTINFSWGAGSPGVSIAGDTFSARWTGYVVPRYSQTYTFYTRTDDGVRLWINGVLIINRWVDQSSTERSGSITLSAGKKYSVRMEYYENTGDAVAQLRWGSYSQTKEIIPQSKLYTN